MRHSETLTKIAPAIVKALAEIKGAAKDSKNPHFKNDYASLESVIEASKETLAKHGLALMQFPGALNGNALGLETILLHESGEWLSGEDAFGIALGKMDAQGVGSALTYARRYAQMSALNIPALDDDAEGSVRVATSQGRKTAAQAKRDGDHDRIKAQLAACVDLEQLGAWGARMPELLATLPVSWADPVHDLYLSRRSELMPDIGRDHGLYNDPHTGYEDGKAA